MLAGEGVVHTGVWWAMKGMTHVAERMRIPVKVEKRYDPKSFVSISS